MNNYGDIDILWLDGGWVNSERRQVFIDMPKIADMARQGSARAYHWWIGPFMVNLRIIKHPEQQIPEVQLPYPWESCMTLSADWGWTPRARFKSSNLVIGKLMEIVAKGGSLLLGAGPDGKGNFPDEVYSRFEEIGKWLQKNGEAIYGTTITPYYNDGNIWFYSSQGW